MSVLTDSLNSVVSFPFLEIAHKNDELFTEWGPCVCPEPHGTCASCLNAKRIEEAGLDWEDEYQKAKANVKDEARL